MKTGHGGKRQGAGRPKGEGSKVLRVPLSKLDEVKRVIGQGVCYNIPLYSSHVKAGFPSAADDYIEDMLDLNRYLVKHPAATFVVKASGDSMINAGIMSGSLLVVDRSIEPEHGKIVIAAVNGELTVKRLSIKDKSVHLVAENPNYPPIRITDELDTVIWGVVTSVIQTFI